MIRAGLYGTTGYAGYELAKILYRHPEASIHFAVSQSAAGRDLSDIYPSGPSLLLQSPADVSLEDVDVVFLCLPHAASAPVAVEALSAGARVVDLSADFRLKEASVYKSWYGVEHPAPDLLEEAVYGLTELAREELPAARLVANPGCYPTSVLLAVQPLMAAGAVDGVIIADSKSGVSGAGRRPKQHTHFVEVADNFSPYSIGRTHRHLPEMEQELASWHRDSPSLLFSPHLLPVPRGILSTIYVRLRGDWQEAGLRALYNQVYDDQPFVQILPAGKLATLAHVNYSNNCVIGLTLVEDMLIITSAIDNLVKGASGQAVQNMNLMFGLGETDGLE